VAEAIRNVLFVCTGNSARSILAEAALNAMGRGRFRAFSAGSHPAGTVNPLTTETLRRLNLPTEGYRSKSWDEFAQPGAPRMDFVFTVCDEAAGEACPLWPGQPITAHWGVPDPAAVQGSDEVRRRAFYDTALTLRRRVELLLALPMERLDSLSVRRELKGIGSEVHRRATANVLVLCTHNSARSVLAEGMINHLAARLGVDARGFSAGSAPSGRVNPFAIDALRNAGVDVAGFRSKSWDEFSGPFAPRMRLVITVCDQAAAETCPFWPGAPVQVHLGYPDPSGTPGGDAQKAAAFELTRQAIGYRMLQILLLPLDAMTDAELLEAVQRIARS